MGFNVINMPGAQLDFLSIEIMLKIKPALQALISCCSPSIQRKSANSVCLHEHRESVQCLRRGHSVYQKIVRQKQVSWQPTHLQLLEHFMGIWVMTPPLIPLLTFLWICVMSNAISVLILIQAVTPLLKLIPDTGHYTVQECSQQPGIKTENNIHLVCGIS